MFVVLIVYKEVAPPPFPLKDWVCIRHVYMEATMDLFPCLKNAHAHVAPCHLEYVSNKPIPLFVCVRNNNEIAYSS